MRSNRFAGFVAVLSICSLLLLGSSSLLAGEKTAHAVLSTFEVTGMSCGGCSASVRLNVKKLDGVEGVKVSHEDGIAKVTYDPDKVTTDDIVKVIEKLGFKAKLEKTEEA